MARKTRHYESDLIRITYDSERCIHAAECVRRLPSVFDPDRRPWIEPDQAPAHDVAQTVERCPTGALHYERLDHPQGERPDAENSVSVCPDGPLYLRGRVQITDPEGLPILSDHRVALCRCGASVMKPLCDGRHLLIAFSDVGRVRETVTSADAPAGGALKVTPQPNGPAIVRGVFHLVDGRGERRSRYEKAAFCRCGHSSNKPFCDGSHASAGFRAD